MGAHWRVELEVKPENFNVDGFPHKFSRRADAEALVRVVANKGGKANLIDIDREKKQQKVGGGDSVIVRATSRRSGQDLREVFGVNTDDKEPQTKS